MAERKLKCSIKIYEDGTHSIHDANGNIVNEEKELTASQLGETLIGRTIKKVSQYTVTYLHANPGWVNINGRWYYFP